MERKIYISNVCGLCNGSENVIDKINESLQTRNNVVMYKEILHNKNVMKNLINKGATLKNSLNELNENDYVIIRAHGEPFSTYKYLEENNITYLDCTCPNVKAIHSLIKEKNNLNYKIIIIGKYNHPEVIGSAGWSDSPIIIENEEDINNIDMSYSKYYLIVQTTFNKDKAILYIDRLCQIMKENNKIFEYKNTVCNAQKRINISSMELANNVDVMIVIGGKNSSNSLELYKNISKIKESYFIENPEDVLELKDKLKGIKNIGITAGASTLKEDIYKVKELLISI